MFDTRYKVSRFRRGFSAKLELNIPIPDEVGIEDSDKVGTKYCFPKGKRAFTLIEMLVTISIIALLTTMVLAYSHTGQSIQNLRRATEQLVSNLRRAESLSMLSFGQGETQFGWGIKINDQSSYSLVSYKTKDSSPEVKSTIYFRKGIIVDEQSIGKTFLFIPPEPTAVYFSGDNIYNMNDIQSNQVIIIKLVDKDYPCYEVRITPTGLIYKKIVLP